MILDSVSSGPLCILFCMRWMWLQTRIWSWQSGITTWLAFTQIFKYQFDNNLEKQAERLEWEALKISTMCTCAQMFRKTFHRQIYTTVDWRLGKQRIVSRKGWMDGRTELSESCVHASNFKNYEGVTHEELRILSVNSPINDPGVHGEDIYAHGILQTRSKAGPSTSATRTFNRKSAKKRTTPQRSHEHVNPPWSAVDSSQVCEQHWVDRWRIAGTSNLLLDYSVFAWGVCSTWHACPFLLKEILDDSSHGVELTKE